MADHCLFFDELLALPNSRSKSYSVHDRVAADLACVEISCRVLGDWFFARKWVLVRGGPRVLYRTLDRLEAAGFRFRVKSAPPKALAPSEVRSTAGFDDVEDFASRHYLDLSERERSIHEELFPEEDRMLRAGYDWTHRNVYRFGEPLARDAFGRVLESCEGVLYEWVPVMDEATWRRYPLERLRETVTAPDTSPSTRR